MKSNPNFSTVCSTIRLAIDTKTSTRVVLKRIHDPIQARQELTILSKIHEAAVPYTVRLLDIIYSADHDLENENSQEDGNLFGFELVMPRLLPLPTRMPDLKTALSYMKQLLTALSSLHALNIAHLDITPSNLMLHPTTQTLVLIDFGLSRPCNHSPHPYRGTPGFIAPEISSGQTCASTAPDMWAAGIVYGSWVAYLFPGSCMEVLGSCLVTTYSVAGMVERLIEAFEGSGSCHEGDGESMEEAVLRLVARLFWSCVEVNVEKRVTAQEALQSRLFVDEAVGEEVCGERYRHKFSPCLAPGSVGRFSRSSSRVSGCSFGGGSASSSSCGSPIIVRYRS
jgi:serine/threonine protein kinase